MNSVPVVLHGWSAKHAVLNCQPGCWVSAHREDCMNSAWSAWHRTELCWTHCERQPGSWAECLFVMAETVVWWSYSMAGVRRPYPPLPTPPPCSVVSWWSNAKRMFPGKKEVEKTVLHPCECRYPLINIYWHLAGDQRQYIPLGHRNLFRPGRW
jgi:hypothetical protein